MQERAGERVSRYGEMAQSPKVVYAPQSPEVSEREILPSNTPASPRHRRRIHDEQVTWGRNAFTSFLSRPTRQAVRTAAQR